MNVKIDLTTSQVEELKRARKNGGVFLKIFSDSNSRAEIIESDGNGGWKTSQILGRGISQKLHEFYGKDSIAVMTGFRTVALAWFIENYC